MKGSRFLLFILTFQFLLAHNGASQTVGGSSRVIKGLNVSGDYELYGSKFNGVTLTNSTIKGALKIDGVKNVVIKDDTITAIWFRGNDPTDNVTIEHNEISGAPEDCIHIHQGTSPATHVVIEYNNIHNCGVAHPESDLYHAIYDQVPGVIIRKNCFSDARAAVSVRSNAVIEDNFFQRILTGGAIEYYSDHDADPGSSLIIKGNVISTTLKNQVTGVGTMRGLIILGNDIGKKKRAVSAIEVQDNKMAVLNPQEDKTGMYVDVLVQANPQTVRISNNTLLHSTPNGHFIAGTGVTDSNNEKTHDPQAVAKITGASQTPCH